MRPPCSIDCVDERSDVFALGAVLFHVLVGEAPYAGRTGAELLQVSEGKVEDLRALVPEAPAELGERIETGSVPR